MQYIQCSLLNLTNVTIQILRVIKDVLLKKIYFARLETKNMGYILSSSFKVPLSVISRDV